MQRAEKARAEIMLIIVNIQAAGASSLRRIAAGLNDLEIPTPSGVGEWAAVQVRRLLQE